MPSCEITWRRATAVDGPLHQGTVADLSTLGALVRSPVSSVSGIAAGDLVRCEVVSRAAGTGVRIELPAVVVRVAPDAVALRWVGVADAAWVALAELVLDRLRATRSAAA